jgi:DNA repair exonuclease SbcCD ATPase subunit
LKKEELLELLKDEEIQEAILAIKKSKKKKENNLENIIKEKDEEIEMLKGLVEKFKKCFADEEVKTENLSKNINVKDNELRELEEAKNRLKNEIEEMNSEKDKLSKKVDFYRDNFEKELTTYALYEGLSTSTKASLKGIFKDDSLKGFLACGLQEKNIISFWDYIKDELREEKNSDIKSLTTIFYFFFEGYNRAYPMYEVQKVVLGDEFDTEEHINTNASSVSGKVDEVVFTGWVNSKTKKIVKKSIVRVK